ncbi:fanconi anemia group E protein FANCE protein [Wolffia australiana]
MERWVPFFQIFLHSPCPEGEASLFLQQLQLQPNHNATSSFLSLLEAPATLLSTHTCMWLQTLPPMVQSRILSFLAIESQRFSRQRLHHIATRILEDKTYTCSRDQEFFWVISAARNLLDSVSSKRDSYDEFIGVPTWLRTVAEEESPLLPWLPISPQEIYDLGRSSRVVQEEKDEDFTQEKTLSSFREDFHFNSLSPSAADRALALSLNSRLSTVESSSDAVKIAMEIQALCFNQEEPGKQISVQVLSLIEPWQTDDETTSVILAHLSSSCGHVSPTVPGLLLASVVLPKAMALRTTASRALLSATLDFCKLHQAAATNALLLPLILVKEGINRHQSDLLGKIIRECLHPSHVSACCQKLLRGAPLKSEIVCLPSHQSLILDAPVWTEALFSLFQQILTLGVSLTPDAVDNLVSIVEDSAAVLGKSLKFCSFLLCMVSKCSEVVERYKVSLRRAAERTDTFITKSILSKLASL